MTSPADLAHTARLVRRARWAGAAFIALQFAIFSSPPDGALPPTSRWLGLAVFAGVFVVLNLVGPALVRRSSSRGLERLAVVEVAVDAAVTLGVVWWFSFDHTSTLWPAMLMPLMEAAWRLRLRGAMVAWAGLAVGYVARSAYVDAVYGAPLTIDSLTYRLGLLAIVALIAGSLADQARAQLLAATVARTEAERRAEALRIVAAAARAMAVPDPELVLDAILHAIVALGYEGTEVCVLDPDGTYTVQRSHGMPESYTSQRHDMSGGLVGRVVATCEPAVVDYATCPEALADLVAEGWRCVVNTPVFVSGELAAVLGAGTRRIGPPDAVDVECLQLLAGQAGAALTNARRFQERRAFEAELRHQAFHDPLTGLANRALLVDRLDHAVRWADRTDRAVAVLFCDLDRFKSINDSQGHATGDDLLVAVGERLRATVPAGATVARLGGDEFTVLLDDVADLAAAQEVADAVVAALAEPFGAAGSRLFTSASVGVAISRPGGTSSGELLREADLAMYRAKERGRGRSERFSTDLQLSVRRRADLEGDLRRALATGSLEVAYQPLIDLRTRRIVAVEALARWTSAEYGEVSPSEFVPLAEDMGVVGVLDGWVLEQALAVAAGWRHLPDPPRVSVNVSPVQLRPALLEEVRAALEAADVPAALLQLEITESAVSGDVEALEVLLDALAGLGVALAIDDFGKGHSSLARLKRFPCSAIKIDRAFVAGVATDAEDRAIVRSIARLGHDLGMTVTAEGIETAAQLEQVAQLGCDLVQGHLLAEPMSAEDIALVVGLGRSAVAK